jgi:hypothetical protein
MPKMTQARRRGRPPRSVAESDNLPMNQTEQDASTPVEVFEQEQKAKGIGGWIEIIAGWVVFVVSLPIRFFGAIAEQFVKRGGHGTKILGFVAFAIGMFLSADGIWQTFFQGIPLFPWFEDSWIGWQGWLTIWINPAFWASLVISTTIQVIEAGAIRGKTPGKARAEYENVKHHTLPTQPSQGIDLVRAAWKDYKKAGMTQRNQNSLFRLVVWGTDVVTCFVGRNPFAFTSPGMILACFAYNIFTILAAEHGYNIWKEMKED